jgi:hypothetical protein
MYHMTTLSDVLAELQRKIQNNELSLEYQEDVKKCILECTERRVFTTEERDDEAEKMMTYLFFGWYITRALCPSR